MGRTISTLPPGVNRERDVFTIKTFDALADDLKTQRVPLKKLVVSDPMTPGLRVIIRNTGDVAFHIQFTANDDRPYLKLGDHPEMKIAEARALSDTILALAKMGINVMDGLHKRLIKELKDKGTRWRP